jgi:hypothetical protein
MIRIVVSIHENPAVGGSLRVQNFAQGKVSPAELGTAERVLAKLREISEHIVSQPRVKRALIVEREMRT